MATVQNTINRTMQMTENARRIAKWQDEIINSMGYKSTIERLNEMSRVLINSNISFGLEEFQKQMQVLKTSIEPMQYALEIISKQMKFSDISSLKNIKDISMDYQNVIKQLDFSNLVLNCFKTPIFDINKIGLIELEYDDNEIIEYDDLKVVEKEEVNNFIVKFLDLISRNEIAIDRAWNEWYTNLEKRHPLTAKLIAKVANIRLEMIINQIMLAVFIFGQSFGGIGVKEEPIANAPVINNVYITNITVVQEENINYYYKVIYVDEEDKEQTGYVSKRKYTKVMKNLSGISEE